jgi:hypothetical protein
VSQVLLTVLNIIFPGSALFWRNQRLQAMGYLLAFAVLNVFRHDIGAMWAVMVWLSAQIHFHKIRKSDAHDFGEFVKVAIWLCAASAVSLYSVLYGPSWTHAGDIKYPGFLYALVVASLILPALLLTLSLRSRGGEHAPKVE